MGVFFFWGGGGGFCEEGFWQRGFCPGVMSMKLCPENFVLEPLSYHCFVRWTNTSDTIMDWKNRYEVKSVQSALSDLKRPPERLQSQCNYRPFIT